MDYSRSYSLPAEYAIVAAWDSQVASVAEIASLRCLLAERVELFPEFAKRYAELLALPRGARRVLQRRLARSSGLTIPSEWKRRLAYSVGGAGLLLALTQGAQAATIT